MEPKHVIKNINGIIILAAGSSSRMGQSKQLLSINGKSLLAHAADTALACEGSEVMIVLGANSALHEKEIADRPVMIITNEMWESGMGSSIKTGLQGLIAANPALQSVVIMLVDQPKVNTALLTTLITCLRDFSKSIVASFYGNAAGVPAAFSKIHFAEILMMDDGAGAKQIITKYPDQLLTIGFPEGSLDLDTPEDYNRYLQGDKT